MKCLKRHADGSDYLWHLRNEAFPNCGVMQLDILPVPHGPEPWRIHVVMAEDAPHTHALDPTDAAAEKTSEATVLPPPVQEQEPEGAETEKQAKLSEDQAVPAASSVEPS